MILVSDVYHSEQITAVCSTQCPQVVCLWTTSPLVFKIKNEHSHVAVSWSGLRARV